MTEFLLIVSVKLIYLISIVCDALSDAIIDKTGRRHHRYEDYQYVPLLFAGIPMYFLDSVWTVVFLIVSYVPLRAGLFNPVYNETRGLGWYFVGTTNWYDIKVVKPVVEFEAKTDIPVLKWYYLLCLIIGLYIH